MKRIAHLTPRYIYNRLLVAADHSAHPTAPWLTRHAVKFLDSWITSSDFVLEFGSGRSTTWFAKKGCRVHTVEHDAAWLKRVRESVASAGFIEKFSFTLAESEPAKSFASRYLSGFDGLEESPDVV